MCFKLLFRNLAGIAAAEEARDCQEGKKEEETKVSLLTLIKRTIKIFHKGFLIGSCANGLVWILWCAWKIPDLVLLNRFKAFAFSQPLAQITNV